MFRGTTPTLEFKIPYTVEEIELGYVTFSRNGQKFMDIPFSDSRVVLEDYSIFVYFSQEDTLSFNSRTVYSIQLRILLSEGVAVASNIMTMPVEAILKNGVI